MAAMSGLTAIIQARMGSTRLPGKVLKDIVGRPMLWHIVRRLSYVACVDQIVVATSDNDADEPIRNFCMEQEVLCFAGSELDVLDRFYRAALHFSADPLIRITADCPFVDPRVVAELVQYFSSGEYDLVGVATGAGSIFLEGGRYPDGLDAEIFSFAALERSWREATEQSDREHVTPYLWRVPGRFRVSSLQAASDYSHLRWTVDNEADLQLVRRIYEALHREEEPFVMQDILEYIKQNPQVAQGNAAFLGQEGYLDVWKPQ